MIAMKTKDKPRLILPEILIIDGRLYHPTVTFAPDPIASVAGLKQLQLEEIISEDERTSQQNEAASPV